MGKITVLAIGKTDDSWIKEGIDRYVKRLKHYLPFEFQLIPDLKNRKKLSQSQQKEQEGLLILKYLQPTDYLILLDENGSHYSSRKYAQFLQQKMNNSLKTLVFVVGGAFGFSCEVYQRANSKLSLSKMTFSHQMVRLIFKEQLYRGFSILRGEKYHHE